MKKSLVALGFAILLLALVAALVWRGGQPAEPPPQSTPAQPEQQRANAAPSAAEPATHYPLPDAAAGGAAASASTLAGTLAESDATVLRALGDVLGKGTVASLFYPEDVVRHIVATIDNLPRKRMSMQIRPVKPVGGKFLTRGEGATLAIAPENAARYDAYVRIAEAIDSRKLTALYVRFYPWFQQAYADLGYPDGYFNDRLIAVIDHLLAAPESHEPERVIQPHVFYQYADEDLEASSAGHKLLIRMGPGNAARIKAKLREIRAELTKGRKD